MYDQLRISCIIAGLAGCAAGLGPSTAATRPLLGQTMSDNDATMWVVSHNQEHVPPGFVRVELVKDSVARIFNYVSVTSAVRKGSATPTVAGVAGDKRDLLELDLALTGRIPLPVGGISVGVGRVWSLEDTVEVGGAGIRASFAPIGQLSIDFARSWVSGTMEDTGKTTPLSGTRTSLGGTLLLWGYNQFRFGVAVAKGWTSTDGYSSDGYTYELVSTMY
jgi:hypothetical protein